jgi:hypothetical protein
MAQVIEEAIEGHTALGTVTRVEGVDEWAQDVSSSLISKYRKSK